MGGSVVGEVLSASFLPAFPVFSRVTSGRGRLCFWGRHQTREVRSGVFARDTPVNRMCGFSDQELASPCDYCGTSVAGLPSRASFAQLLSYTTTVAVLRKIRMTNTSLSSLPPLRFPVVPEFHLKKLSTRRTRTGTSIFYG